MGWGNDGATWPRSTDRGQVSGVVQLVKGNDTEVAVVSTEVALPQDMRAALRALPCHRPLSCSGGSHDLHRPSQTLRRGPGPDPAVGALGGVP